MAKSSRGRGRKSRSVDWVVNDETYGLNIALPNATQTSVALTIPKYIAAYGDAPTFSTTVPAYQYPEQDEGQVAYAVRGQVRVQVGAWASGSAFQMMMRIVKKPCEWTYPPQAIVDPNYTLFTAEFANERFLWQTLHVQRFEFGGVPETVHINWKGTQKLNEEEALWLFLENQSGITQTLTIIPYLRTLMRADE